MKGLISGNIIQNVCVYLKINARIFIQEIVKMFNIFYIKLLIIQKFE